MAPPPATAPGVQVDPGAPARPAGLVVAGGGRPATPATTRAADDDEDPAARPDAVDAVAFDASGTLAVAGRRDGTVEVWDLRDGTLVHRLSGHASRAVAVAFSRDGARVASASWDGTARVWDVPSGEAAHVLEHATGERRRVLALALARDGEVAATAGEDGRVRLWDLATGACLRTLVAHERAARAVVFDANGAILLTAGDDHLLRTWTRRGDPLVEVPASAGFTHAVLDGPDVALAAGAPQQVERFDLVRRARVGAFPGEGPLALTGPAAAARDRGLLVRAGAGALRLVDPERGDERARLVDPGEVLLACDLSPDGGRALTGAESGRIKLWDLRAPDPDRPARLLAGPAGAAAASGRERVVVAAAVDREADAPATAGLRGRRGVDVEALRHELRRAADPRRREIVAGLDPTDPAAFHLLLEVLASAHAWTVRLAAAEAIGAGLGDPRVLAAVDQALASAPARAREGVTWALGLPRSPALMPRLVRLLGDEDWPVRRAAAVALGRTPDARAVAPLVEAHAREAVPGARALLAETLEQLTGASPRDWAVWLHDSGGQFRVRHDARRPAERFVVERAGGQGRAVVWSVRVRGEGPPLLVLPEVGYRSTTLEAGLRWLEGERTVVHVDPDEEHDRADPGRMAARLALLRDALVARGLVPDAPEVVVGHGLSAAWAAAYPGRRPRAGGLVLVAPLESTAGWSQALRRVAAAAELEGDHELLRATRVLGLARGAAGLQDDERAALRRALFTSWFADRSDLLIGHLLGPRAGGAPRHAAEWAVEPSAPGGVPAARAAGWHGVPTLVLVDPASPWTVEEEAARLAAQSQRGRVLVVPGAGRLPLAPSAELRAALGALTE
ncbi:MAG: HEAT repeat domain-containing protein [Planctomycetes bacterium]|nr:HEAT repeat domain-containing protein [Planctomycetota bacterium]